MMLPRGVTARRLNGGAKHGARETQLWSQKLGIDSDPTLVQQETSLTSDIEESHNSLLFSFNLIRKSKWAQLRRAEEGASE